MLADVASLSPWLDILVRQRFVSRVGPIWLGGTSVA